ncbi:sugar phosphate nucleotidyltransferase [Hydrogenophaga sp.]|uniref:sugar phosphate nucleotidyltransferase n=1 Tax=Hydrogenophaga sp. TaxID=1904254 RepID=UPI003567F3D0
MKVVLFCGGMGTRMREFSETIPKPLVNVGHRPIIWHLMRHFAHFGHTDFILCLGYKGEMIREYFLNYNPMLSEDCRLEKGVPKLMSGGTDVRDWNIDFVDTGLTRNIGQRLVAARHLLRDEEVFLANYSDQLCDIDLDRYVATANAQNKIASFVSVRPPGSYHSVTTDADGTVNYIGPWADSELWINGGYMVLRQAIFDHIEPGDELVEAPFQRLIAKKQLYSHRHEGFWKAMDTYKDKLAFDEDYEKGRRPWEIWNLG